MLQLAHEMGGKRLTEEELLLEVPYLGAGAIKSHLLVRLTAHVFDLGR